MFKLRDFETVICDHANVALYTTLADECDNPKENFLHYRRFMRYLIGIPAKCFTGQLNCYPITYWLLLSWTLLCTLNCLYRFCRVYCENHQSNKIWRNQRFHVLPSSLLRKWQMLVLSVKLSACLLLLYAVVNVSPKHFGASLMVRMFLCCCKITRLLLEAAIGKVQANKLELLALSVTSVTLFLIWFAKAIFEHEVALQGAKSSQFWRKFLTNYKFLEQTY